MKRSNAIRLLSGYIEDLQKIEGITSLDIAEDILDILEDMGIEPPKTKLRSGKEFDRSDFHELSHDEEGDYIVRNEWDSEE